MNEKNNIHNHVKAASRELLKFIKDREAFHESGWVPAAEIKRTLDLNFVSVPKQGKQYGAKGWLFAVLARMLEDLDLVEYKKEKSKSFYKSK